MYQIINDINDFYHAFKIPSERFVRGRTQNATNLSDVPIIRITFYYARSPQLSVALITH